MKDSHFKMKDSHFKMKDSTSKILCIIPARSGSKGIIHKNIKIFNGIPLLAWSIRQVLESATKMRIVVSTDSIEYKDIALKYGAEVPFLRPKNISGDFSTDFEVIKHCIEELKKDNYNPELVLHIRPTQPCRKIFDIDECIRIFNENKNEYDSLRSVIQIEKTPYKMYKIENNSLIPFLTEFEDIIEPFNQCRQKFPQTYLHNGYIDIYKVTNIQKGTLNGKKIFPYIMEKTDNIDIDNEEDWLKAENQSS